MAVTFITWLWGNKYDATDVQKLYCGLRRNYRGDLRLVVFSDGAVALPPPIETRAIANPELIGRGCFCRLRMFSPEWQAANGFDDRIVCVDLDAVMVGELNELFERPESFLILHGANAANPCPFNASIMMLRAGAHADVWADFTQAKANAVRFHEFPDDQGWIWHKLPDAAGWKVGEESGIYAFHKPGWPKNVGYRLPPNARIVSFVGWRKPKLFAHIPWVKVHWRLPNE